MNHCNFISISLCLSITINSFGNPPNLAEKKVDFLPGYVVTVDGDTLRGFILLKDHVYNSNNCAFKKTMVSSPTIYDASQLKGYLIDGKKYYYAHTINPGELSRNVFLECILEGTIGLYFFQGRFFVKEHAEIEELVSSETTFVQSGKTYARNFPVYKGTLQKKMNDCSTIHQNIKDVSLNRKDLTRLFKEYFECVGSDFTVFDEIHPATIVSFGLSIGSLISDINITSGGQPSYAYLDNEKTPWDVGITTSILLEFSSPKSNSRFRTGLTYYSSSYRIYDENEATNLSHELTVENIRLEIPVLLKYSPLKRHTGFYLLGGAGINWSIKWEGNQVVKVLPSYVLSESESLKNNKFFVNILAGTGLEFPVRNKKCFIETTFGQGFLILEKKSNSPSANISAFTLSAGLML